MQLTDRQRALLAVVVERYVETAEAVGSTALAADSRLARRFGALSSATIRNDLKALESAGLLAHPHTSAGRIPTHAGYRFYINEIMRPRPVRAAERARIDAAIDMPALSVEDILHQTTVLLAQLTGYPAVASLPMAQRDAMRHVQINHIPPHRLILMLVTVTGRIEHRFFEIDGKVSEPALKAVVDFLNQNLGGRSLFQLRSTSWEQLAPEATRGLHGNEALSLARAAWDAVHKTVGELEDDRVVVQGMAALFDEPEFAEIENARAMLRIFDDSLQIGGMLRHVMETRGEGQQSIVIGGEWMDANHPAFQNLSFVGIHYGAESEVLGTVGVMGPTRMKYGESSAVVLALAERLRESLMSL
jgi:heat-inducible transcriptional repressor